MSGQPINAEVNELIRQGQEIQDTLFNTLPQALKSHLSREIPEQLWHYTSLSAMQSIIQNKEMYATDARFLNDREELIHAAKYSDAMLARLNNLDERVRLFARLHVARTFRVFLSNANPSRRFVTCFTSKRDDLSQWRAYSGSSSGASLGFDFRTALAPRTLAPCIYDDSLKEALLSEAFSPLLSAGLELFDENPDYLLPPDVKAPPEIERARPGLALHIHGVTLTLLMPIMTIFPLLKDKAFEAEDEWRIVKFGTPGEFEDIHPIFFRARSDALVETMKINLTDRQSQIPLTGLILGPGCHSDASDAATRFLRSVDFDLLAKDSKVPYRATS